MPGEYVNHFNAVRFRINGTGNLLLKLISLDNTREQTLVPLAMQTATNKNITKLANFTEQQARLRIETNEIDETFLIRQIIIYTKPVSTGYPQ